MYYAQLFGFTISISTKEPSETSADLIFILSKSVRISNIIRIIFPDNEI